MEYLHLEFTFSKGIHFKIKLKYNNQMIYIYTLKL